MSQAPSGAPKDFAAAAWELPTTEKTLFHLLPPLTIVKSFANILPMMNQSLSRAAAAAIQTTSLVRLRVT